MIKENTSLLMRGLLLVLLGLGLSAQQLSAQCALPTMAQTATNTAPGVTITTGSAPQVLTSTITVVGFQTQIIDLNVFTNLAHTFPGDLDITLTSPAGTIVTLTSDNGGTSDNSFGNGTIGTTWNDAGAARAALVGQGGTIGLGQAAVGAQRLQHHTFVELAQPHMVGAALAQQRGAGGSVVNGG